MITVNTYMYINAWKKRPRRMHTELITMGIWERSGIRGKMAKKDYSLLYNVSMLSKENIFICQSRGFGVRVLDSLNLLMSKMKISNLHWAVMAIEWDDSYIAAWHMELRKSQCHCPLCSRVIGYSLVHFLFLVPWKTIFPSLPCSNHMTSFGQWNVCRSDVYHFWPRHKSTCTILLIFISSGKH